MQLAAGDEAAERRVFVHRARRLGSPEGGMSSSDRGLNENSMRSPYTLNFHALRLEWLTKSRYSRR